jgi:hypothetical protein
MAGMPSWPLLDVGEEPGDTDAAPAASHSNDIYNLDKPAGPASVTGSTPTVPVGDRQIVVRTAGTDGSGVPHETHFGVVHRSGCLWLRNSG